jgi:hypothetical protein
VRPEEIERRIALVVPGYIEALQSSHELTSAVCSEPVDHCTHQTIIAGDGNTAARSRHRRTVHVLPDPCTDGPEAADGLSPPAKSFAVAHCRLSCQDAFE